MYMMCRVFAIDPSDRDSVADGDIPNIQKIALDASLLNTQHQKVRIKFKGKRVALSVKLWCSSY